MEKDINKIQKNADTDIIIRIDDFGGKRGVTIREFVKGERYTGFTKAGTRIPVEHFKAFRDAINSITERDLTEGLENLGNSPAEKQGSVIEKKEFKPRAKSSGAMPKSNVKEIRKVEQNPEENINFEEGEI